MTEEEQSSSSVGLRAPVRPATRPDSPMHHRPVPSSRRVSRLLIEPLLKRPERIRNVCILAHVDHGKTTLTDSLLASNGIISFKQAGTLRYMDAREDEQERGITMESSAVSLLFDLRPAPDSINGQHQSASVPKSASTASLATEESTGSTSALGRAFEGLSVGDRRFLVNLIDSPGHVDFSSQVATASKLCDGCLVLVDAVEGVCTQTAAVLRQAYRDRLTPCLVINKMDRLVTELKLSSTEAAEWLFKLLAQVNAIQATVSQRVFEPESVEETGEEVLSVSTAQEPCCGDEVFNPAKGNVIFASATDGWAFRIDQFARLHSRRLEMKETVLQQTLWGEFYMDTKAKRVLPKKAAEKAGFSKPMFAQFILDNIWPIYEATNKDAWDQNRIEKIAAGLNVKLPLRELKARDGRTLLRTIMTSWLPLAESAFAAIVDQLPNPTEASRIRVPTMFPRESEYPEASQVLLKSISSGDASPDAEPTVAYLSKQFAVTTHERVTDPETGEDRECSREKLIGMARVFHGTLSVGQEIYVLRPKFNPAHPEDGHYVKVEIQELFLLMGRDLEPVETVYAGNVFGISGLEEHVGKSATLSTSLDCPSFDSSSLQKIVPIVRVALHPAQVTQMEQLVTGLNLLCQADPCAEMHLQEETGEYILAAAGELHLEQCLKDLRERFTKIEIEVSSPMVPFRESITDLPAISDILWKEGLDEDRGEGLSSSGVLTVCTPSGNFRLGISSTPLPQEIVDFILTHKSQLKGLNLDGDWKSVNEEFVELLKKNKLEPALLLSLGPRRLGPNLLMASAPVKSLINGEYREFVGSIISGFQVGTEQGPLCAEPMMGVRFTVESLEKLNWPAEDCHLGNIVKGQLISAMKDACHRSFLSHSPRLMLAMYSCNIQTTAEVLGRVYSVVARRMGTILSEEYNDGTGFFTVNSLIPVIESFGFADDIRGRTSGLAIPQLLFHGFRLLDQDPFWVPSTEEELEDFGEIAEKANVALRYLIGVRERKGLFVEKKIVQFAEKQRTLKK